MLCYLGFLSAISNTEIVQWKFQICLPDRMPVIRVILISKSRIFGTSWRSQRDILEKLRVIYQYAFPDNAVLHFIITHMLFSIFVHRIGSVMF